MFGSALELGTLVKGLVLSAASFLTGDAAPGIVVIVLLIALALILASAWHTFRKRIGSIKRLRRELGNGDSPLLQGREKISAWFNSHKGGKEQEALREAWSEFDETLFIDNSGDEPLLRNSVRPSAFFNIEDLHFGQGFYRIWPGLFVSIGLALTFLGLIAALNALAGKHIDDAAMSDLLRIASAKFIMSLTGLVCSIVLTIGLRIFVGSLDEQLHRLCRTVEARISFASLEQIAVDQLRATIESREHQRQLTLQMIAEIGGPLKSELPQAISSSITTAMQPIMDRVSQQGTDSIATMATDLSQQVTQGVAGALGQASEHLARAGDKISQLADRMDQSSGRMGSEMEQAVARVAQAVDELRGAISASAQSATGVFNQGAEQLLGAMNRTLESIRDNTGEGARAISAAAVDMRDAAIAMRSEIESAARSGADAAKARLELAGEDAGKVIGAAGQTMLDAFSKAGADIAGMTQALSSKAGDDLIAPIEAIARQLDGMVSSLASGADQMRRLSDAVRDGASASAEAAGTFRGASQELVAAAAPVRATSERIEGTLRQFADGTRDAVATVRESSRATAEAAARTLEAARETIAAERQGVESSLAAVTAMLERLRGQGDRMDTIDVKLGHAFDLYSGQTEQAMQAVRSHVQTMAGQLNTALSTLQTILDGLQEFQPQQGRS
ncbi:hypothetical protein [Mesorhizobium sp. WSM3868]|uniref:hypothetical protein n=1 Tax=Mesorhizobium sp. WSM3868 TaxID=2029405 RepID=UPI000BAFA108|nr:hypothetical protein [Mesorhizobium sp. WSM3868]PBB39605.1 hypothetical protein CK221_01940 [Mesorhizobium sp. WSM3868]